MGMVTNRSLLILVDHSKTALTLSKAFYDYLPKPSSSTTTDGIRIFQIMRLLLISKGGASSASELVTELIQFQNSKKNRLSRMQASVLMAGMMLDTKNSPHEVTSRTF